ncbi:S8 family serine peptidase [Nesterenkonia pannonica]|uniref:S8 family serine peptidase n=1 Tax=Nesterenkonia pannonica TaxID=1548602 RepID=UPI00216444C5|nr:S8 family serine peptidase [Nesterenkonia pannonica]
MTIAVIDTGVDGGHPTLEGAVVGGADFSGGGESSGAPVTQAATEHGTLVASLAAGRGTDPDEGMADEDLFDDMGDDEWDEWFENFEADLEDAYGDDWEDEIDEEALDEFYETREFPLDEDLEESGGDEEDEDTDPRGAGVIGVAPARICSRHHWCLRTPIPTARGPRSRLQRLSPGPSIRSRHHQHVDRLRSPGLARILGRGIPLRRGAGRPDRGGLRQSRCGASERRSSRHHSWGADGGRCG